MFDFVTHAAVQLKKSIEREAHYAVISRADHIELHDAATYVSSKDRDYFVIEHDGAFYAMITASHCNDSSSEINCVNSHDDLDEAILDTLSHLAIDSCDDSLENYLRVKNGSYDR